MPALSAERVQGDVLLGSGGSRSVTSVSIVAETMEPATGVREQSTTGVSRAGIPSSAPPLLFGVEYWPLLEWAPWGGYFAQAP